MKVLTITVGNNGANGLGLPTPESVNGAILAANVAESITVPSGATHALFSSTADFYANYSGTATVITDTSDGSASELNPTFRTLDTNDTISVISGEICYLTVSFYG